MKNNKKWIIQGILHAVFVTLIINIIVPLLYKEDIMVSRVFTHFFGWLIAFLPLSWALYTGKKRAEED